MTTYKQNIMAAMIAEAIKHPTARDRMTPAKRKRLKRLARLFLQSCGKE